MNDDTEEYEATNGMMGPDSTPTRKPEPRYMLRERIERKPELRYMRRERMERRPKPERETETKRRLIRASPGTVKREAESAPMNRRPYVVVPRDLGTRRGPGLRPAVRQRLKRSDGY